MSSLSATAVERAGPRLHLSPALLAAIIGALVMLAIEAGQGFSGVANFRGDNDSVLRMVEIRDLMAGQSWFDLTQYRLGLEGGTAMHWSRLVDAPIAGIIWVTAALTGSTAVGEAVAVTVWPLLTYAISLFFLVRAAERLGGEAAILPAAVIGGICLYSIAIFGLGAIDHHNIQFALTVATISLLLDAEFNPRRALPAGVTAGLSIAIGMETAPYVAAIGSAVALFYLVNGERFARVATNYGVGFAGTGLAVLLVTLKPSQWGAAACDAFSAMQFAVMTTGGLGLAAVATLAMFQNTATRRATGLGLVALALAALMAAFFPQCLAGPMPDLDPRQKIYWLDGIKEAQSAWAFLQIAPGAVFDRLATPLLALAIMAAAIWRKGIGFGGILIGLILVAATLVTFWQIRGGAFAAGLAVIPLAAWLATWRAAADTRLPSQLKMIAVWMLAINLTWGLLANLFSVFYGPSERAKKIALQEVCVDKDNYALLKAMPAATVLSGINQGSLILNFTHHRVIEGPYHRNTGNIVAYEAISSDPTTAQKILTDNGVSLVAICRGIDENPELGPGSFHAQLMRGNPPSWLHIVPASKGQAIEIYQVDPALN